MSPRNVSFLVAIAKDMPRNPSPTGSRYETWWIHWPLWLAPPFEKEIRAVAEAIFEGLAPTNSLAIKLWDFFEFPWDPFPSESVLATPVLLSHSQDCAV